MKTKKYIQFEGRFYRWNITKKCFKEFCLATIYHDLYQYFDGALIDKFLYDTHEPLLNSFYGTPDLDLNLESIRRYALERFAQHYFMTSFVKPYKHELTTEYESLDHLSIDIFPCFETLNQFNRYKLEQPEYYEKFKRRMGPPVLKK